MARIFTSLIIVFLLTGCAVSDLAENAVIPPETITVAQADSDGSHFYWYTYRPNQPVRLGERVFTHHRGQYQADYQWRLGKLSALYLQGDKFIHGQLQPFDLQLRFDSEGLAVFQRYQQGTTIVPLTNVDIQKMVQTAYSLTDKVIHFKQQQLTWVQGHWFHQEFISCQSKQALSVTMNQKSLVLSGKGYMAVNGQIINRQLVVDHVLLQRDDQQQCLMAPDLLKNR